MAKTKINYSDNKRKKNSQYGKYGMILVAIILTTLLLPKQPRFQYEFAKGQVWNHENLSSPYRFAILKTQEELEKDRENILSTVQPIYILNTSTSKEQIDQFNTDFSEKWQSASMDTLENINMETYRSVGNDLLVYIYKRGIISPNKRYQVRGRDEEKLSETDKQYNYTLTEDNIAQQKNTVDVFTIESANHYIHNQLERNHQIEHDSWLEDVLKNYLAPNHIYNEQLTDKIEQTALSNISQTRGVVEKDELIVENGSVINSATYQKLLSLRKVFEDEAKVSGSRSSLLIGQFIVSTIIIAVFFVFLFLYRKEIFNNNRLIFIILIVITTMLALLSWASKANIPNYYYIPYCSVPIIFKILFDTRIALNIHILMILIAALFVSNSFEFVFIQFIAGMVAIYSIQTVVKREQFLIASLIILVAYIVSYLGFVLARNGSLSGVYWSDILPFIVSVGLTLLAYPLIYAFEKLFGLVSDLTLMELANSNSKLLRDLSLKAPGTFQHSLQVANLSEAAVYKIGGNPLLVRAAAMYHDIGKMTNPLYFIENQKAGQNPHEELTPEQSAQIIISHVFKGIEIAKKNNLPATIIEFIRTHHGTTRVDYFYNTFIKNNPDQIPDESIFTYPGPPPHSKEMAILMMADSVEAASRAMKDPTEESINNLVDKIIEKKLTSKQFINADITMRDIQDAADVFKMMLKSIYHVRIDYELAKKKE